MSAAGVASGGATGFVHDRLGWWIAEAGAPAAQPALSGDVDADVVVVGGGYTGMWTAWHVAQQAPDARVVVLEAEQCGFGPSGRNGGFVESLWLSLPALRRLHGDARAVELAEASRESVRAIGAWCEAQGVDAWFRPGDQLVVSTTPAQDGVGREAVDGAEVVALSDADVRARCASPVFREGVAIRTSATVHPARLAFGLRARLLERGVRIFERSPVRALAGGGPVEARCDGGRVRARTAVVALNAASGLLRPLRTRLTVGSSHIVVTEPVPDVLDALGWRGGEAISDGRALLHYFRTTRDDRIVFGWAGGRMAAGARRGGRIEVDPGVVAQTRADLVRVVPQLTGRRIDHAWGGPIDVSPSHLPAVVSLPGGRAWAAFGFTGNGVGPSHLAGRALASLALERRDPLAGSALVDPPARRVPPEPWRAWGAAAFREALIRKEAAEEDLGEAPALLRAVSGLPARLGVRIVR